MNSIALTPDETAAEVLAVIDRRGQIEPLSERPSGLDLASAYEAAAAVRRLREQRGERVVGRKIGFTNTTIWAEYNLGAPIWGYVYDTTLHRLADLDGRFDISALVEPRIEPEIMVGISRAPEPGMDERALLSCIEWVAHGFEVVQSIFPGWRFTAADTVAAFGLHGALLVGPQAAVMPETTAEWHDALAGFEIALTRDGEAADHGRASNVLAGGPLTALRHLVEVLAADLSAPPLAAGEVVSTGTLTRALPIEAGETWSTKLSGIALSGVTVTVV
jgi:2-oxo-3-hexenedioate decarboxylase